MSKGKENPCNGCCGCKNGSLPNNGIDCDKKN